MLVCPIFTTTITNLTIVSLSFPYANIELLDYLSNLQQSLLPQLYHYTQGTQRNVPDHETKYVISSV